MTPPRIGAFLGDLRAFVRSAKKHHQNGMEVVSKEIAEERAKVCQTCPYNKKMIGGCPKCARKIVGWIIPTTEDLSDRFDLKSCGICKCFLKVKVWMPWSVIDVDDRDLEFPPHCWIAKREAEVVNSAQDV